MENQRQKRRQEQRQKRRRRRKVAFSLLFLLIVICCISMFFSRCDSPDEKILHTEKSFGKEQLSGDWNLILVNQWNKIPDGYAVKTTKLRNGQAIDTRAYPDLQKMIDDCKAAGLSPLICSSYRTQEKQQRLFDRKVAGLIEKGYTRKKAEEKAGTIVAVPGTSEHQTGLALDIVDMNHQNLDETQEQTDVQQWLLRNSWKYGFVLRYPNGKSDITGTIYEPWHYRYVGKEAAKEMKEQDLCLEEYLEQSK